jgi:hypothetical protein
MAIHLNKSRRVTHWQATTLTAAQLSIADVVKRIYSGRTYTVFAIATCSKKAAKELGYRGLPWEAPISDRTDKCKKKKKTKT